MRQSLENGRWILRRSDVLVAVDENKEWAQRMCEIIAVHLKICFTVRRIEKEAREKGECDSL